MMTEGITLRTLLTRDMPEVLRIEGASFDLPWSAKEFDCCRIQPNMIGIVAEVADVVVGFMFYELTTLMLYDELTTTTIRIVNIAVDPNQRRLGIASAMIRMLKEKLVRERYLRIVAYVRERNLPGQLLFHSCGFTMEKVRHGYYESEDAYQFAYWLPLDDDDVALEACSRSAA